LVQSSRDVQITATCDGTSIQTQLRISILTVAVMVCNPAVVNGGVKANCLVTLTGVAPVGGLMIQLHSDKSDVIVPVSVVIPAGKSSCTFAATTLVVGAHLNAQIRATLSGESAECPLSVLPPVLAGVVITPSVVKGGVVASGVVKLAKAVSVPVTVALSSSASDVAAVPQSVTIPAGSVSVSFQITTTAVLVNKSILISATTGVTTKVGKLTVTK
jgi:hypothetical protein